MLDTSLLTGPAASLLGFFIAPGFMSPGPMVPGLPLRWYGLLIALAVLLGLLLAMRLGRSRGVDPSLIADLLPLLVLGAVLGARTYYVLLEARQFSGAAFWTQLNLPFGLDLPLPSALAIWQGGIAIHGALLGGTLTVVLFCRWRRQPLWPLLDVLVPSVALGQAIGRWGNFFNSEAFGLPTDLPWAVTIPWSHRPDAFLASSRFHPTFLYESLWDLAVCGLLLVLIRQEHKGRWRLPPGSLSCLYLVTYSCGRFWIEALRLDPLCIGALPPFCMGGLRMAQLVSLLLILLGVLGLWWLLIRRRSLPDPAAGRARAQP